MKRYVLSSALALTASIFADGEIAAAKSNSQMQNQDMMMQSQSSQPAMINLTSARPESNNGWYLFADALYWHADVDNTDWAWKIPNTADDLELTGPVHHLDFKWDWGFRVGVGVNLNHDMWDSNFYYTWFQTQNSNGVGVDDSGTVFDNILLADNYISGSANWSIHYSMFDWELGRWYYVSKNLGIRPHVGVKGGWINQNIKYHKSRTSLTGTYHLKNDFWGVGPSAGLNSMWILGNAGARNEHRFTLFGDVSGSIMYGHFENSYRLLEVRTTDGSIAVDVHPSNLNRNLAAPMLQAMMGLSWDVSFNQNKNHFTFKAGYELQYWLRQNQLPMMRYGDDGAGLARFADDLAFQGLTFDFRFDF